MAQDEYNKVELPAITQLQELGWTYIHGDELSPDHPNKERNSVCRQMNLVRELDLARDTFGL